MTQPAAGTGLRSLGVSPRYRSNRDNVVEHFYVPCLGVATAYSRAVGYFTSTSLALFSRGLDRFIEREGTMRLVASPHLNADDILDIERGYDVREVPSSDMAAVKTRLGVPMELASCHTARLESSGQIVEGHVPASAVRKLLASKDTRGVAAPGMPMNSPGMGPMDGNLVTLDFDGKPFSRD